MPENDVMTGLEISARTMPFLLFLELAHKECRAFTSPAMIHFLRPPGQLLDVAFEACYRAVGISALEGTVGSNDDDWAVR